MFRNLEVEKTDQGEFRVSFVTDQAAMLRFIKFFRLSAKEADFFYHKTLQAIRTAELRSRKLDPSKQEAVRWERKQILRKYRELSGTHRDRFNALRRHLLEEGKPVSYDGLQAVLQIAREQERTEKLAEIRRLLEQGIPYREIARRLGGSPTTVINSARDAGIYLDRTTLEKNLANTVQKLDREGLSARQIANHLGIPLSLVNRVARRHGAAEKSMPQVPREELAPYVAVLAAEGLSFREIGHRLQISEAAVSRYAKRMEIRNPMMQQALRHCEETQNHDRLLIGQGI